MIIVAFLSTLSLLAQKQGNVWHFGKLGGLDFNSGAPAIIAGGQTATDIPINNFNPQEGTASICDSAGALLFYTGGKTIWNKFHQPMPNGSNLIGGTSSTQSSIIIPKPGNDTLFYVFTSTEFQSLPNNSSYRYSVVNMCRDNGRGDVLQNQKNVFLSDSCTEKLAACRDAAGTGYWIVGHEMYSKEFHAWHLTTAGITTTVTSAIGTLHGWSAATSNWVASNAVGQMKFDPAGTKLAVAIGSNQNSILDLFDFNNVTGVVSSFCNIDLDQGIASTSIYGVEFSPNGSRLYATIATLGGGSSVYQFDMNAGGGACNAIASSSLVVYQDPGTLNLLGMQLGPDKKIYIAAAGSSISSINSPDLAGFACNVSVNTLVLPSPSSNHYTLPSIIAGYAYLNKLNPCCPAPYLTVTHSNNICPNTSLNLNANGATTYTWNPMGLNGSNISITPSVTTIFTVIAATNGCTTSVTRTVNVQSITPFNINNGLICGLGAATLSLTGNPQPGVNYTWLPGSVPGTLIIVSPTVTTNYSLVAVHNVCNFSVTATNTVTVTPPVPAITGFNYTSPVCAGNVTLIPLMDNGFNFGGIFNVQDLNINSLNGEIILSPFDSGTFTVVYSLAASGCTAAATSTANIIVLPLPSLTVSPGINILPGSNTTLSVSGGPSYTWSPADHLSCVNCDQPVASPPDNIQYCVSSLLNGCISTKCIDITVTCEIGYDHSVPNAFTPNNDGHNDAFCLQGFTDCITNFNVMIFDRWGEKVFESNDPSFCWDGIYKGQLMNAGVFVYVIKATKKKDQINKKGNITLIR